MCKLDCLDKMERKSEIVSLVLEWLGESETAFVKMGLQTGELVQDVRELLSRIKGKSNPTYGPLLHVLHLLNEQQLMFDVIGEKVRMYRITVRSNYQSDSNFFPQQEYQLMWDLIMQVRDLVGNLSEQCDQLRGLLRQTIDELYTLTEKQQ